MLDRKWGIIMIIKEGKRNFNDIDIRDIYSICYDIIRNDSSLYNRNCSYCPII